MDELKNIAPKLSEVKKENPFGVPENYFEDFSAKLHSKIESSEVVEQKKPNTIIRILKPVLGLAASFAIIFMLVYWPLSKFDEQYTMNNDVEETEIVDENYSSLIAELDENSFYTLLDTEQEDITFSEDELVTYLSTTMNEYDLYAESK